MWLNTTLASTYGLIRFFQEGFSFFCRSTKNLEAFGAFPSAKYNKMLPKGEASNLAG
jgi:hypothetical protein